MKLSQFKRLVDEMVTKVEEDDSITIPDDPEIVFSMGKPTENKLLEPQGMGVVGASDGEAKLFIDFRPSNNPVANIYQMMKGIFGEERAKEIIKTAREAVLAKKEEPSTNSKVDA